MDLSLNDALDTPRVDFNFNLPVRKFIYDYGSCVFGCATTSIALFICNRLKSINNSLSENLNRSNCSVSNPLEEICQTVANTLIANKHLTKSSLDTARIMYSQVVNKVQCVQLIGELNKDIHCQRELCLSSQRMLVMQMWYNEEIFASQPGMVAMSPINRSAMMIQMTSAIDKLGIWRLTIAKIRSETAGVEIAINQRLNWAVGANSQIADILNKFTAAVHLKKMHYDQADHLSDVIVANCSAILTFERLRFGTAETLESDQQFFDMVSAWEKSCNLMASCIDVVTPVEEALIELLDPEGPLDLAWLNSVVAIIAELCDQEHDNLVANKRAIGLTSDSIGKLSEQLRTQMSVHQRLAGHVKGLLRKMMKVDTECFQLTKEFLRQHTEFVDLVSEIYGHTLRISLTEDGVEEINLKVKQIDKILGILPLVFDGLFSLQPPEQNYLDMHDQMHAHASPTKIQTDG